MKDVKADEIAQRERTHGSPAPSVLYRRRPRRRELIGEATGVVHLLLSGTVPELGHLRG